MHDSIPEFQQHSTAYSCTANLRAPKMACHCAAQTTQHSAHKTGSAAIASRRHGCMCFAAHMQIHVPGAKDPHELSALSQVLSCCSLRS